MVLLIPRRIKQIKDEGIAEGLARGRKERREEWLAEYQEGFVKGFRAGRESTSAQTGDEDIERLKSLIALYDSGYITSEEVRAILSRRYSRNRQAD